MSEATRETQLEELKSQFLELHSAPYETNLDNAQERGRRFERLVRGVFDAWGMLIRGSYHTGDNRSEQIDGVLMFQGRYALLEAKWEKANLAASELFSFLGKVEGKFTGTIGVFVSRNELTPNFLTALRAGRRQCIIVIHGQDVDDLFEPQFDLAAYLEQHLLHVCMDNLCHLSTEKFKSKLIASKEKTRAAASKEDDVQKKINECLQDESAKNIVNEFAAGFNKQQRIEAIQRIVNNYVEITTSSASEDSWRGENLHEFLRELIGLLPQAPTSAEEEFFIEKLSKDYQNPYYRRLIDLYAPRYIYLSEDAKKKCEDRLIRQWDKVINDWMGENRMAEVTRPIWNYLADETKTILIGHFVEFVLSIRGTRHDQYRLADLVLDESESVPTAEKVLKDHAHASARSWLEDGDAHQADLARIEKAVMSTLRPMRKYLPRFEKIVEAAVAEAAEDQRVDE